MKKFTKPKKRRADKVMKDDWFKLGGRICRVTEVRTYTNLTFIKFVTLGHEPDPFWTTCVFHNKLELPPAMKIRVFNQK